MNTDEQFAIVPLWLLESGASDRAIAMYSWLAGVFDEGVEHNAGLEYFAARTGKSESYITRAMKELADLGAITRRRRMNSTTLTTIHRLSPQIRRLGDNKYVGSGDNKSDALSIPIVNPDQLDPEKEEVSPSEPTELEKDFKEFYAAFPIRREPDYAERKYRAARKKATHAEIMAGIGPYVAHVERRRANGFEGLEFQAPGAWLNKGRWADEYEVQPADTDERRRIEKARRSMSADQRAAAKSLAAFPYDEQSAQIMGESKEVDNVSSNNGSKAP